MKSFKTVAEEFVPKFQRATKTDVHYTGQINGKTYVVPHAFHGNHDVLHGTKVTPIRHSIVVSPIHVQHNNPTLTPEEAARVHAHIKDIHGGQDPKRLGNLDETWLPMSGPKASKETPEVNAEHAKWEKAHAPATRRELKAARPMRTGAADRFMRRYGKTNEERQLALHLGMRKSDSHAPKPAPVVKPKRAPSAISKTENPEAYQAERNKYRHAALIASRKAATLAFAKKHHIINEDTMLNENKYGFAPGFIPKAGRGDVATYHQTQIAKKTLRMPDAMLGVMGGPSKEDSRKHLKKMGWTEKQIHDHEHAQFTEEVNTVQEHVWNVTDHLGHTHEVEAKDHNEAKKKTVSVGGVHPQGIPMTQWHKVRVERKNLEERTLTTGEDAKKEEIVHSMKKKLQGFKERYGKDAKSVMYATATKQAKQLAEETLKSSHGTADGHSHVVKSSYSNGKFSGTVHTSHRDNRYTYTGPEARSPVEHEKPKKFSHDVRQGTTASVIRKKNPHLDQTQALAVSRHFDEHKNKVRQLSEGVEPLEESFMGTYTRNENANRHTANIVHLAKHFGDAADQAQAKFYAAELKKHGHNIHHEAQYKLHEKLFPKALAAHHMKEGQEHVGGHDSNYRVRPMEYSRGISADKKKTTGLDKYGYAKGQWAGEAKNVKEEIEQLDELKMATMNRYVKKSTKDAAKRFFHGSEDDSKIDTRVAGIQRAVNKGAKIHPMAKDVLGIKEAHSDTFNTVKRVLSGE